MNYGQGKPGKLVDKNCAECGEPMKRPPGAKYCADCLHERSIQGSTGRKTMAVPLVLASDGGWDVAPGTVKAVPLHVARIWQKEAPELRNYARVLVPA